MQAWSALTRRAWMASAVGAVVWARQEPTFTAGVQVVNVFAMVRDKKGEPVTTLSVNDFTLEEEGREQSIRYFARESDLALTLGLLVDTSMSQARLIGAERTASVRFFEKVLREDKDHAFLIHFDREVELLQDVTNSRARLEKALNQLETPKLLRREDGERDRGGYGRGRLGTTLYDAVLLASDELMRHQKGRKALVLLSDGVDYGSKVRVEQAIEAAQRADTQLYAILYEDHERASMGGMRRRRGGGGGGMGRPPFGVSREDGVKVLKQMAAETGGALFEVKGKQGIDEIYLQLERELRSQYNLGYTPEPKPPEGQFRSIRLTVKKKDLQTRCRAGYYPSK